MNKIFSILVVTTIASHALTQISGGAASYGQQGRSGVEQARANELAKRTNRPEDGKYIEASVLMNVLADEYVAVFGINEEGKTLDEARQKMEGAIRTFTASLRQMKLNPADYYVDFVAQNRIYGYVPAGDNAVREVVVGFEIKKNVIIRYKDKTLIDQITEAASKSGIFDLVKVDYVVKDIEAVQTRLVTEAARILKRKMEEQERLLGVKVGQFTGNSAPNFSIYYPADMYDSYVAQESESMEGWRQNFTIQRARKPRTFYFNGLTAKDFDSVINPVVNEPVVQFTVYVRIRY
ncbi:MAG: SIMPL domain-containing protein [Fimbriimonadaceae bacterium]